MRMSELFGRTLRSSSAAPGSGQAWADRSALARSLPEGTAWLPLGERVRARAITSLKRAFPTEQWLGLPPGQETSVWPEAVQAEVQSYRQVAVRLAAQRAIELDGSTIPGRVPMLTDALQWAELCAGEAACSHAGDVWRGKFEAWAESFGAHLRGAEQGLDRIEVAYDRQGAMRVLVCGGCGYAGVEDAARWVRIPGDRGAPEERRRVATPGARTIDLLASSLQVERSRTLKAVFLADDAGSLTFVVLPGDLEVSLWKLGRLAGSRGFRPATPDEIRAAGAVPGYASPVGLRIQGPDELNGVRVVVDSSVSLGSNYVAGANEEGYHFTGVNFPRDFRAAVVGGIALAAGGAMCVQCGHRLELQRGVAVGSLRILDTPIMFTDERGGLSQTRLTLGTVFLDPILLAIIQAAADEVGIVWPAELAPYAVHVVDLKSMAASLEVEALLSKAGLEFLFDDRPVSTGVKFADADLIGCPVRITVGARSQAQGGVEVSGRTGANAKIVPLTGLLLELRSRLGSNYVKAI